MKETSSDYNAVGPFSYQNWKAMLSGAEYTGSSEYELFTDAYITGELDEGIGPYKLLNGRAFQRDSRVNPAVVLRTDHYQFEYGWDGEWQTEFGNYHGGSTEDEVAALTSLSLGIRLKSAGVTRMFKPEGDPKGMPVRLSHVEPVMLPGRRHKSYLVPSAFGSHCLNDMDLFSMYADMSPRDATALIIAARLYQNALWIVESEPELAWPLLVSAVETAASYWGKATDSPGERLRGWKTELYELLFQHGGDELVERVAEIIVPMLGSSSKFLRFLLNYLPGPPAKRPAENLQIKWTKTAFRSVFNKIYEYRSIALHSGRPFPLPMCELPPAFGDDEVPLECPTYSMRGAGGTWLAKDIPLALHMFEYITRHALISWWRSMMDSQSS